MNFFANLSEVYFTDNVFNRNRTKIQIQNVDLRMSNIITIYFQLCKNANAIRKRRVSIAVHVIKI